MARWYRPVLIIGAIGMLAVAACGNGSSTAKGLVHVLYAASLQDVMEHQINPQFTKATGYGFAGEGKGSTALASEITGHLRQPEIFISADPAVNATLMGAANGNYVSWYANFAGTQMVIGFSSQSHFAADLQAAQQGQKNWYDVLREPGLRLGRTDPKLDPKGYRSIIMLELAETYYHQSGLRQQILGADENPAQIFPEETLVSRLETGQLDAGIFYTTEVQTQHLPSITLPAQINLGDPAQATFYKTATTNASGKLVAGAPILYTVTIPSTSHNSSGAEAFVKYLLGSQGQQLLHQSGLTAVPFALSGDRAKVPSDILPLLASS